MKGGGGCGRNEVGREGVELRREPSDLEGCLVE